MPNTTMFVLQLQVPIIAGDIVEAQKKAESMVADKETGYPCIPFTFFQVLPANVGESKK